LAPDLNVSNPFVEGRLLQSPRGYVLVLSNWSGGPREVTVRVKLDAPIGKPRATTGSLRNVMTAGDELTFTTHVEYGQFVVLPHEERPPKRK